MFSPRIYWRMFESMNQAFWPLHLPIAWVVLVWLLRGAAWWRSSALVLAGFFALSGWAFLASRFAPVFWVAEGYAWAFAAQAVCLVLLWLLGERDAPVATVSMEERGDALRARIALGLALWAGLAHPLLAPLAGRSWMQAEWVGLAPDPTAVLALAWLLKLPRATGTRRVIQRIAWVVPMAWCLLSAATLATMGEWQALVMLVAPMLALFACCSK